MVPSRATLGLVSALFSIAALPLAAATFVVNSTADAVDANPGNGVCATAGGVCTLRAAVQEANALAGTDTIDLPAGTYLLTIAGAGEDAGATGDLDVSGDLTVNGASRATTIISGNSIDRIFDLVTGAANFTIDDATLQNGRAVGAEGGAIRARDSFPDPAANVTISNVTFSTNQAGDGGAISVFSSPAGANLTITGSSFDGNSATGEGGAIWYDTRTGSLSIVDSTFGTNVPNSAGSDGGAVEYVMLNDPSTRILTVLRSVFEGNTSGGEGGALYLCCGTFEATVEESTFSGNTATDGGGAIYTCCSTALVTVVNSTLSGNTAGAGGGGGVDAEGRVTFQNATLANNTAPTGAGFEAGAAVTARNTIFSNSGPDCGGDQAFFVTSLGNNIASDGTCTSFTAAGDQTTTDPLLGPLADNGGPSQTHALLPGSPAIDAGSATGAPPTDQRGVARPQGAAVDIGAFESAAAVVLTPTTTTLASSNNPSMSGNPVTFTATVASGAGTPTGSVTFRDGATVLGSVALAGGTASLTTSSLAVGSHSITATYEGDATFAASTSAPLTQVVAGAVVPVPLLDWRGLLALVLTMMAAALVMIKRE